MSETHFTFLEVHLGDSKIQLGPRTLGGDGAEATGADGSEPTADDATGDAGSACGCSGAVCLIGAVLAVLAVVVAIGVVVRKRAGGDLEAAADLDELVN
ncbi:hypothetical protein GRS48_08435 [Halorubrum sp. JWXQ-INN 858]|uniref:hypothetical protein n=1 Tax=Halorubrum sp. JWXQ-INN 858 TaxID=2690782 RepID=UPI00135709A4|nr:hypothetical protein [Halorubrum sp. JWXQ-INN 858]MWV64847.1 hypothetical protein [Halorubrum sp. JWXQ-INN 858]